MEKFSVKNLFCVVLSFSACSTLGFNGTVPPTAPESVEIVEFIEGKFSEFVEWKILDGNVVDMTTKVCRELIEVVDDFALIYKNENNEYFKMKVNYYVTHGEYLFWSSQVADSLDSARENEVIDEENGYFVVDEFLETVEGKVSADGRKIINGDIYTKDILYFEYAKNINSTTAIYKAINPEMYIKYVLNVDDEEFLFKISGSYDSIEKAENDSNVDSWRGDFKVLE